MKIEIHKQNSIQIAEILSDAIVISNSRDGLNLLADFYYQGFDGIMLYEKNISPLFFDLRSGLAGEILQKFSNYRFKLAIIGDFSSYKSQSLKNFIFESNKVGHICFVHSREQALANFA